MTWILHQDCRQCWVFNVLIQNFRLYMYCIQYIVPVCYSYILVGRTKLERPCRQLFDGARCHWTVLWSELYSVLNCTLKCTWNCTLKCTLTPKSVLGSCALVQYGISYLSVRRVLMKGSVQKSAKKITEYNAQCRKFLTRTMCFPRVRKGVMTSISVFAHEMTNTESAVLHYWSTCIPTTMAPEHTCGRHLLKWKI